jgi:hypothetical protein
MTNCVLLSFLYTFATKCINISSSFSALKNCTEKSNCLFITKNPQIHCSFRQHTPLFLVLAVVVFDSCVKMRTSETNSLFLALGLN